MIEDLDLHQKELIYYLFPDTDYDFQTPKCSYSYEIILEKYSGGYFLDYLLAKVVSWHLGVSKTWLAGFKAYDPREPKKNRDSFELFGIVVRLLSLKRTHDIMKDQNYFLSYFATVVSYL